MSDAMLNILARAAKTRMKRGELLEDILDGWPKLTNAERKKIEKEVKET